MEDVIPDIGDDIIHKSQVGLGVLPERLTTNCSWPQPASRAYDGESGRAITF